MPKRAFKIIDDMIHPELRKRAKTMRSVTPNYSENSTRMIQALCRLMKGHHSKGLHLRQIYIPRPDGSKLRLCVYTPLAKDRKENVPGLLWIHGGGYSVGLPEMDDFYIRRFVADSGCVVVSPDYTLSLQKPYPAALDDCYAALVWLKEHGIEFGMCPDQIFVGGESAGGGLTACISILARDKGEVKIAFQMPLFPMLDDRLTESSRDNDAPICPTEMVVGCWKWYLGDYSGRDDVPPYAAPARAADYAGLPPTCTFVGSIEAFRDETVTYIENLKSCGIPVHFRVFEGCFHAFDRSCPETGIAKEAAKFLMDCFAYAVDNYFATQN